jgi:hypothetical protein
MNKLFTLILGMAILTSCEKTDEAPAMSYPTTFVSKQYKNTTPIRMYTKNGEVKNPELVKKFAEKWSSSYYLENKVTGITYSEKLTFTSQTTAEAINNGNTKSYAVEKSGSDLILTSPIEGYVKYTPADEYYMNLIDGISKYKPLIYDKQTISSYNGYSYVYKTKPRFYTTLRGNELHYYQMLFTYKSGPKDDYSVKSMKFANRFDPSGIALLQANDTLVVQEFIGIGVKE